MWRYHTCIDLVDFWSNWNRHMPSILTPLWATHTLDTLESHHILKGWFYTVLYKVINNLTNLNVNSINLFIDIEVIVQHCITFRAELTKENTFFKNHIVNSWKSLPEDKVSCKSLFKFLRNISRNNINIIGTIILILLVGGVFIANYLHLYAYIVLYCIFIIINL